MRVSVCVVEGRSGLAITLVTPFDISLFQAVEAHIGKLFNIVNSHNSLYDNAYLPNYSVYK